MRTYSIGHRLFATVLVIFLTFAVSFIIFQWNREKQYKIDLLESRLQGFNMRMDEAIQHLDTLSERELADYVSRYGMKDMRVTLVDLQGRVVFDNVQKNYVSMANHANRPEIAMAKKQGAGSAVDRRSKTLRSEYFYSATFFPDDSLIIRSALPHNTDLLNILEVDQHFLWFAVVAILVLALVLYRFVNRLGTNITKLKIFAARAEHNESLETEDLAAFPGDELGEIAEKIIKIYKRLQTTRREQDMLKRQLTQNIAHELKTPVAGIQGYLETIIDNEHIDAATREQFIRRCYAQSERLSSLLQDISTLNRMDDAPDMQKFEEVDVAEMVRGIQRETALQLHERQMVFDNRLPSELRVEGNRSLLYSIFRNLTDNAIAYAGNGTTITLLAELQDAHWCFSFADNGVGVAAEHLPRLFERFYRVDKGRSRKMGGTGLGLAIVKNAVLLHHGNISVKNNLTGGLLFSFSLAVEANRP